ncbi:TIR domain-containing protein [Methylobacterium sp. J-067]|uniref:TIR domain-containing protein n=1 Tax=Methylobacterium sp. J-067 TaxID=2836648 RepID=UPI001FB9941A|nr:nucleotide-binding protein [Methylobacterium sp. J-067]MCJ2025035.1 nucleotide-binding protein [Methylobacterium sp. J-067]
MDKWFDGIEQLQALVDRAGVKGSWEQKGTTWRFSGIRRQVLNYFTTTNKLQFQGQEIDAFKTALVGAAGEKVAEPVIAPPLRVEQAKIFVVHGHDTQAREQLELCLMKLGLQPFILMNAPGGGKTIIEALEHRIYEDSAFGIVLMTPDDYGYSKAKNDADRQPRARQNVILEAGMIMAALGRPKLVVLKKGALEMPSDLDGLLRLEFNDHVKEVVPKLAQSMIDAGIPIDPARIAHASS